MLEQSVLDNYVLSLSKKIIYISPNDWENHTTMLGFIYL